MARDIKSVSKHSRAYKIMEASRKTVTIQAEIGASEESSAVNLQFTFHKEPEGVACPSCKAMFKKNEDLAYHLFNCNKSVPGPSMGCTDCNKGFTSSKELRDHIDGHFSQKIYPEDEKKFVCGFCDHLVSELLGLGIARGITRSQNYLTLCEIFLRTEL